MYMHRACENFDLALIAGNALKLNLGVKIMGYTFLILLIKRGTF